MHPVLGFGFALLVGVACGYAFRGLIHKDVVAAGSASSSDLRSFATRIENEAIKVAGEARTKLYAVAAEIRTKI